MQDVIVVTGKDPVVIDGGSESYIRAYGRAAIRAGYGPHYFCVGTRDEVEEVEFGVVHRARFCVGTRDEVEKVEFGVVHRARSPFRPFRGLMVAAHERYIVNSVDRFVGPHKGPHLSSQHGTMERSRGCGRSAPS